MAVYDLEEQEQIDELKSWWRQYRQLVLLAGATVVIVIGGVMGWRNYQARQGAEAAELYVQMQQAAAAPDWKKVQDIAGMITEKYSGSGYAAYAALAGAKAAFDTGDAAGARTRLQWVMQNARDEELRDIARLRLAAVMLDGKQYDEALKTLESRKSEALLALYADLKGDILVAQGNLGEARAAYQLAFDKSDAGSAYRALIQLKLDSLGGGQ